MKTFLRLLALTLVVTGASFVHAQAPAVSKPEEKKYVAYRITRADVLSIGILGEPDMTSGNKRVEALGTINLPYIGDVRLVGLTIKEAQELIENAYRDGRILRNPTVTIVVDQYAARTVMISGKVNSQGRFEIPPDSEMTIKDLIFKANGLGETAKGSAIRLTRTRADGTMQTYTLDVESAIKGKQNSTTGDAAFVLQPDDVIYVPEKII